MYGHKQNPIKSRFLLCLSLENSFEATSKSLGLYIFFFVEATKEQIISSSLSTPLTSTFKYKWLWSESIYTIILTVYVQFDFF